MDNAKPQPAAEENSRGQARRSAKQNVKRWLRRLLAVALILAAVYVCRVPILRALGRLLVVDESPPATEYLLLLDDGAPCKKAAQLIQDGYAARVLVVERKPTRLQRLGILPALEEETRLCLKMIGLPDSVLIVLHGQAENDWDRARRLHEWLADHPENNVAVLCHRFGSRRKRWILNHVLPREEANRVGLYPVPDPKYDESNWWLMREGLLDAFGAYLRLIHVCLHGESLKGPEWNPDQYEQTLR